MLSSEQQAFLRAQPVGRLATADAGGRPSVVPICFAYAAGAVYTPIDEKPKSGRRLKRLRNIEANPRVAMVVDRYEDDWSHLAWVIIRGAASLVADAAEKARALAALREKYPQYRAMALEDLPLIRVVVERVSSWGDLSERS